MRSNRVIFKSKLISNSVERAINKTTSAFGLTSVQASILGYLYNNRDEEICQRNIETNFNITHPTATGIIGRLEDKGFVTCLPSEKDRRFKIISVTEKAISLHNDVIARIEEAETLALAGFTDAEKEQLHRLLDKVIANVMPGSCVHVSSPGKGADL